MLDEIVEVEQRKSEMTNKSNVLRF